MWKRIAIELGVVAALALAYLGYSYFVEYRLVRNITFQLACGSNPQAAIQMGVPCVALPNAAAQPGSGAAPAAPSSTEKPGDDKKGGS